MFLFSKYLVSSRDGGKTTHHNWCITEPSQRKILKLVSYGISHRGGNNWATIKQMPEWAKHWVCKHEDLSLNPQTTCKARQDSSTHL